MTTHCFNDLDVSVLFCSLTVWLRWLRMLLTVCLIPIFVSNMLSCWSDCYHHSGN